MWDLKLILNDFFFFLTLFIDNFFFYFLNFLDPFIYNGFSLFNSKILYQFPQNVTFFFTIKYCFCIALLILVRGGLPRYRYDYLTKLGWLKFLGLIILVFFFSLFIFVIF